MSTPNKSSAFTLPPRPKRMVSRCGKFEIIPGVEVYSCKSLHLDRKRAHIRDIELEDQLGPIRRIMYCYASYDVAMKRAEKLLRDGVHPSRITFLHAYRDTVLAFEESNFTVIPLLEEVVEV